MTTTKHRALPVALTLTAGIASAALILSVPTLASAAPETHAAVKQQNVKVVQSAAQASAAGAASGSAFAKVARVNEAAVAYAAATTYAAAGGPATTQDVQIGDTTGRIWYKKISTRKLYLDGKDSGWIARYDIQVRRADGKVIFDENLSVYRTAWFVNEFKPSTKYSSEASLVAALNKAASVGEISARATFKKKIGSLGEFKTTSGATEKPYDFSQHPGVKYIPLNYKG